MSIPISIRQRDHAIDRPEHGNCALELTVAANEQATRNLLASIVESSDDAIFAVSLNGTILSWNRSAEKLYGYSAAEAIGKPVLKLMARDHQSEHAWTLASLAAGEGIKRMETVRTRKDGSRVEVALTVSPIHNAEGVLVGGAAVVRDITERKQTQEAIRQSEEKYRTLLDSIPDVVWTADENGRLTFVSANIERMCGFKFEELNGPGDWVRGIHPGDVDKVIKAYKSLLRNGEFFNIEYRFRKKDGSWIWLQSRAVSRFESGGELFTIGISSDVTVRKLAEEQLHRAKEMAEISHRVKSEFLSNMGHELRTPLNGILGFGSLLLDSPLNDEQRQYVNIVESEAKTLLQTINDVLDFSSLESQKLALVCGPFEIQTAVQSVVRLLKPRAEGKGLSLFCRFEGEVPETVVGDSGRLRQVLQILVENAIKFTKRGSVTVAARRVDSSGPGIVLEFSVADTGIGIQSNKIQEIFEPFVQADMSAKRSFGGTGLGLSISSQIVKMMGGKMWVASEAGKGSTFSFTLPLELS